MNLEFCISKPGEAKILFRFNDGYCYLNQRRLVTSQISDLDNLIFGNYDKDVCILLEKFIQNDGKPILHEGSIYKMCHELRHKGVCLLNSEVRCRI